MCGNIVYINFWIKLFIYNFDYFNKGQFQQILKDIFQIQRQTKKINLSTLFTSLSKCTPSLTNYLCKWDDNSCVSHLYKCEEFSSSQDCPCYWNLDNKCAEFKGCSNYDERNCPASQGCAYKISECQAEDYVTCSDQTSATCVGKEGMFTVCTLNNDNKCDSYSIFSVCSDLNNFKTKCVEFGCKFENNECQKMECEDLSFENCTSVNVDAETKKLCVFQQQKCVEAQNTNNLNIDSCYRTYKKNILFLIKQKYPLL